MMGWTRGMILFCLYTSSFLKITSWRGSWFLSELTVARRDKFNGQRGVQCSLGAFDQQSFNVRN